MEPAGRAQRGREQSSVLGRIPVERWGRFVVVQSFKPNCQTGLPGAGRVMAERLVVLVENDPVLSERLRAVLSAHNFKVELIADGNELITNQTLRPVLIILCIDPKRLGWAICNKVKRTNQFKDTPMIVTSQEATDKDFEDHKKLRTRAEEYLHKPYSIEVLLGKVDRIVGLRAAASDDAVSLDDAVLEELSIDEAVIEEEISTGSLMLPKAQRVDEQIDVETESAFAAIAPSSVSPSPSHRTPVAPASLASMAATAPIEPRPQVASSNQATARGPVPDATAPLPRRIELDVAPGARKQVQSGDPTPAPTAAATVLRKATPGSDPSQTLVVQRAAASDVSETLRATVPVEKASANDKALAEALSRAEKAEAQSTYWHDQRDLLASERDRLSSERDRLATERERGTQQLEQANADLRRALGERDQLVADRNQLLLERNQLASERDALRLTESKGPPPELLAAQARLSSERDQLLAERERWTSEGREQRDRIDRLTAERDDLIAGHDRLAAEFSALRSQLADVQQALHTAQAAQSMHAQSAAGAAQHADLAQREAARAEAALSDAADLRRERDRLRDEVERLQTAASNWSSERAKLHSEIDEAKIAAAAAAARPSGSPASGGLMQSRELITLKEIINKKDKEILDLRDALDAKDRQVLDARDKAREQERQRRELDEKLLEVERESLGFQEKIEALMQDKDVWHEREKGLKGRLEDAQRKLARLDEDLQSTRKRLETEAARGEAALAEERKRAEATLAEQRRQAEATLGEAMQRAADALASEQKKADAALQQLVMERAQREAELQQKHENEVQRLRSATEEDRRALEQRHAQAWAQFEAQYQARFEERVRRHEAEISSLQQSHDAALQDLRQQLAQAQVQAQAQLEQLRQSSAAELAALRAESQQAQHDLRQQLTGHYEGLLAQERRESEARYRLLSEERDRIVTERSALAERASGLEVRLGELLQRQQNTESELATVRAYHAESEAAGQKLRDSLRDRDAQLHALQAELQTMQEQVQAAYQRLLAEEDQRKRTRRALTIALGILDEGGGNAAPAEADSARTPREG